MYKNDWVKDEVLSNFNSLTNDVSSKLAPEAVFILSIGSFVSSNNSYNSTIQMHPTFADELASNGAQVYVYNFDHMLQHAPKSEGVLNKAVVSYVSMDFYECPETTKLISDILNADAKIILIDNTSKKMTDFTQQIATQHREKIHHQLEVVHRYIGLDDGVAFLYHPVAFDGTEQQRAKNIAHTMRIANECDCYAAAGKQTDLRQNFIDHPEEYQESIQQFGQFFPAGLADIKADELFKLAVKNTQQIQSEESLSDDEETQEEIDLKWQNFKLILFVVLLVLTFPVSLPILGGYYYHCQKNEKPFNPLGFFESKKVPHVELHVSVASQTI